MPPKEPGQRRLIDGLPLLEHSSLPPEFRRFRNDDLYFIQHCLFMESAAPAATAGGDAAAAASSKQDSGVPRFFALTPAAFFVTDGTGKLHRATRFENVGGFLHQATVRKKLFGSEPRLNVIVKIDKEPDCFVCFDGDTSKDFVKTFTAILKERRPDFAVTDVPASEDFRQRLTASVPEGYVPPQEVLRMNRERQGITEHIEEVTVEIADIKKEIGDLKPAVEANQALLKQLGGATDGDLTELRRKQQSLHAVNVALHKTHTAREIELYKTNQDIERLQEQLRDEKANRDRLVESTVASADSSAIKEQNDMTLLRQKAQKREADKLADRLAEVTAALAAAQPQYAGHEGFVSKAKALDAAVAGAVERWVREMDAANKVDKFIDHMVFDMERVNELLVEKHKEKMALIASIEGPAQANPPQQQQGGSSGVVDIDDISDEVPLGNKRNFSIMAAASSSTTTPNRGAAGEEDDLLGDAGAAAPAPPSVGPQPVVVDDIDDI